jgi:hypothetical protein
VQADSQSKRLIEAAMLIATPEDRAAARARVELIVVELQAASAPSSPSFASAGHQPPAPRR